MTKDPLTIAPDTLMTEIAQIFDEHKYHHLPVVDSMQAFVGMVSKSDYFKLQHHFTILKTGAFEELNEQLFSSLIASDIMQKDLHTIQEEDLLERAIDIFLENRFHSLIVVRNQACVGILTPHDILQLLKRTK
jgi:CBS domain-containing protein